MAKKPATKIDVDDILNVAATASAKAKTSKVPAVSGFEDLADEVSRLYTENEDAEAAFRKKEADLIAQINKRYEEFAKRGTFSKSINVLGEKTAGVQVSYRDQFVDITADKEADLKNILTDKYDLFFKKNREISVKITDDDTVRLLITKLGKEDFIRIFDVRQKIATKPDMDRKQFTLPSDVKIMLRQYKPAVKLIKKD